MLYQDRLCHLIHVCKVRGGARMGSAKSDRTLKHSDIFTCYEELGNWDPMNFLMSQNVNHISSCAAVNGDMYNPVTMEDIHIVSLNNYYR